MSSKQTATSRSQLPVLLIDDREGEYLLVKRLLAALPHQPYRLHWASTAEEALRLVDEVPGWHALLIDYNLGDTRTGLDLLADLGHAGTDAPMIVFTVVNDAELDRRCMTAGAADFLVKSELSATLLHRAISHAVERRRMQREVERSERRYRTLARHLPACAVLAVDASGRCASAHGQALNDLGIDSAAAEGATLHQVLPADLCELLHDHLDAAAAGDERSFEAVIAQRAYLVRLSPLPLDEAGGDGCCQVVLQDVTELRSAEQAAVQSARLASIGTLTGGLAHEFNNIHSLLLGHVERLHQVVGDGTGLTERVDIIRQGVWRAAEVTRNLLSFARGCGSTLALTDLDELIDETLRLVRHEYAGAGITLDLRLADLPKVWLQPAGISQVLINLLINARHAVEDRPERRITISTSREAGSVYLRVEDTGRGMSPEELRHAFDPFFTTKLEVDGAGLGLTVCRTIVANHGGDIMAMSEPDLGSIITVSLPLRTVGDQADATAAASDPAPRFRRAADAAPRRDHILVVDDDANLRALLEEVLVDQGWEVEQAGDGVEALDHLRRHPVDLVVVDLHMPRCDGWAFVDALRQQGDPPAVVLTSGHLDAAPDSQQHDLIDGFLAKPFTLDDLCATVARSLERRAHYRQR